MSQVVPADFANLEIVCWNRRRDRPIDREDAWALYRAEWRWVDQDNLAPEERQLIESLEAEFGNGEKLLGTDGPPHSRIVGTERALKRRRLLGTVLATVNAPYGTNLKPEELAAKIVDPTSAERADISAYAFFTDVWEDLQLEFIAEMELDLDAVRLVARQYSALIGWDAPLAKD